MGDYRAARPALLAGLLILTVMLPLATEGRGCADKPFPGGDNKHGLSLTISQDRTKYAYGDNLELGIKVKNHRKEVRSIRELLCIGNRLKYCASFRFVIRFEDGYVGVTGLPLPFRRVGSGAEESERRPLALPAEGMSFDDVDLTQILGGGDNDTVLAVRPGKGFSVTIIVPELGLRSNTITFNGFKGPKGGSDPFRDAEAYKEAIKKKQEELERRRRLRSVPPNPVPPPM